MTIRNSAICLECNTEVESKHRHDYVRCPCGNVAVDGGKDYFKRSVRNVAMFKDTSICEARGDNGTN